MATPASMEHLPLIADNDARPDFIPTESMSLGTHTNGIAVEQNSIPALPPLIDGTNEAGNELQRLSPKFNSLAGDPSSHSSIAPIKDIASGIAPTAPFLPNTSTLEQPTTPQSAPTALNAASSATSISQEAERVNGFRSGEEHTASEGYVQQPPSSQDESSETAGRTGYPAISASKPHPIQSSSPQPALVPPEDEEMTDGLPAGTKVAREREDDDDAEPSAKRARTEDRAAVADGSNGSNSASSKLEISSEGPTQLTVDRTTANAPDPSIRSTVLPTHAAADTSAAIPVSISSDNGPLLDSPQPTVNFGSMTDAQNRMCLEGLKNIRKSRLATAFQKPVDIVALKIPTYPDIIKIPMDLSTMEQKLKGRQYTSVNEYVADFDIMVQNSVTFNGPAHVVSQNATGLRAQLNAQLKRMPRPGQNVTVELPKKLRKPSVSIPREPKPRASRPSIAPSQPPAIPVDESFALDADGMPQIRRHSSMTDGRPKREIHKPPPKDLPYSAKPKKKKYQQELKFCLEVLDEITRPAYANSIAGPFMQPVDPVALNIPNYRSVIKKPMDFGTVREKLATSNYENGKEFEADVKLIFNNCYKFNGKDHFVSKMATELEGIFDQQMQRKSDWLSKHAPQSAPQSPEADSDVEEEEDEEEDDEEAQRQAQLSAIHAQFAELSGQLLALQSQPPKRTKSVGKKTGKPGKAGTAQARRKSGSMSLGAALPIRSDNKKVKARTKPLKAVTTVQKEEISEKIGLLTAEQMGRAADIIKASLRKAGRSDLADRGDDEMEFEIDQIPDEALHELLKLVRKSVPSATKSEDVDYRPVTHTSTKNNTAANQGKVRKNKPMKGTEQDMQINRIKAQLNTFHDGGTGGVKQEGDDDAESSDDDSESGSESEEE